MRSTPTVRALVGLLSVAGLVGCSTGEGVGIVPATGSVHTGPLIGVSMPTVTSERWVNDGESIKASLEKLGYRVDLQYAQNDVRAQIHQLEYQITKGVKLLIVGSIDGGSIGQQMAEAEAKKIPVIAYDRLVRNSNELDYYTSFDNYKVGVAQATSLLTGLGITKNGGAAAGGALSIEIFAGSPDDNNATFFFKGAMDTLKPYLDDGRLVVRSGQTDFKSVSTLRWEPVPAKQRMTSILAKSYGGRARLDGVLSPNDDIAIGVLEVLKSAGYGSEKQPYPVVTGQDCTLSSVKSIMEGAQYSTIFKDTRQLAEVTVKMADEILKGRTPATNNTTDYDNGKKVVSSYLLQPVIVTKANYKKVLFDSGYYSLDDLE